MITKIAVKNRKDKYITHTMEFDDLKKEELLFHINKLYEFYPSENFAVGIIDYGLTGTKFLEITLPSQRLEPIAQT